MDDNSPNIDQRLLEAYLRTTYQVENLPIEIRIGTWNQELDLLLQRHKTKSWAFISAWNLKSLPLSENENEFRHQELLKKIRKAGYPFFEGKGIGEDTQWPPEKSLLILGISKTEALKIGQHFEQNAIILGHFQQPALLLFC
ncbi:MAG: DUF3293 domain-containing protein [Saprospiraceae bacterium]|nr:DUF3293 domain-containing protein [Saprospiraceae bacterium]